MTQAVAYCLIICILNKLIVVGGHHGITGKDRGSRFTPSTLFIATGVQVMGTSRRHMATLLTVTSVMVRVSSFIM